MKKYFVIPNRIDNHLEIDFNGGVISNLPFIDGDPDLGETLKLELTNLLDYPGIGYPNTIQFKGFNGAYTIPGHENDQNPFHFEYRIVLRHYDANENQTREENLIEPVIHKGISAPKIYVHNSIYTINKNAITGLYSFTKQQLE